MTEYCNLIGPTVKCAEIVTIRYTPDPLIVCKEELVHNPSQTVGRELGKDDLPFRVPRRALSTRSRIVVGLALIVHTPPSLALCDFSLIHSQTRLTLLLTSQSRLTPTVLLTCHGSHLRQILIPPQLIPSSLSTLKMVGLGPK